MNVCGIDVSKDTLEIVLRKNNQSQKSTMPRGEWGFIVQPCIYIC